MPLPARRGARQILFKALIVVERALFLTITFAPFAALSLALLASPRDSSLRQYWLDMLISTLENAGCSYAPLPRGALATRCQTQSGLSVASYLAYSRLLKVTTHGSRAANETLVVKGLDPFLYVTSNAPWNQVHEARAVAVDEARPLPPRRDRGAVAAAQRRTIAHLRAHACNNPTGEPLPCVPRDNVLPAPSCPPGYPVAFLHVSQIDTAWRSLLVWKSRSSLTNSTPHQSRQAPLRRRPALRSID